MSGKASQNEKHVQQQKAMLGSPPVSYKDKCKTWAHQNWPAEDWENVAWSDEAQLLLWHADGGEFGTNCMLTWTQPASCQTGHGLMV